MATQIIDNFQLNVAKPIDSRMVTSGTASRNSIQYLYEGLRVYDLINKAPYVYIDGAWQQESSSGGTSGGTSGGSGGGSIPIGTTNKLLKYTSSTTVGESTIFDKGTFTTPNVGIGMVPVNGFALDVNGVARATVLKGAINGSYVDSGSIDYTRIAPGFDQSVLKTINGSVVWTSATDLNTNIVITNQISDSNINYLLFSSLSNSPTGTLIYANKFNSTRLIGIKPSTSQILGSGDSINSSTTPGYAFSNNTTAGLYGNTTEVGLSFDGISLLRLNSAKLSILNTSGTEVMYTGSNKVIFPVAGEFGGALNVTNLATVGSLIVTGTSTFDGISTGTLTTSGAATLASLSVSGAAVFNGSISTTSLNVTGTGTFTNLTVTGTTNISSLSLTSTLNVSGLATIKDLNVTGIATFNNPITGTLTVTDLTVNTSLAIGGGWSIIGGHAILKSLKVSDGTGASNTTSGLVYCNKIRIKPTTISVPYSWNASGYGIGDIIFVADSPSDLNNGSFYFNKGQDNGWWQL